MTTETDGEMRLFPETPRGRATSTEVVIEAEALGQEMRELVRMARRALDERRITQAIAATTLASRSFNRCNDLRRRLEELAEDANNSLHRPAETIVRAQDGNQSALLQLIDEHWMWLQQASANENDRHGRRWIECAITVQARLTTAETVGQRVRRRLDDANTTNAGVAAIESTVDEAGHIIAEMARQEGNAYGIGPEQRADLQARADEAMAEMRRILEENVVLFNSALPTGFSELTETLPEDIRGLMEAMRITPARAGHLVLDDDRFLDERYETRSVLMASYHDGMKIVRAVTEPLPADYSDRRARRQVQRLIGSLAADLQQSADPTPARKMALREALIAEQMIYAGVHKMTAAQISQTTEPLDGQARSRGRKARAVRALCQTGEIAAVFQRTGQMPAWRVSEQQVDAIIEAAARAGMDMEELYDLAIHLGYEPSSVGVPAPPNDERADDLTTAAAIEANISEAAMNRLISSMLNN